MLVFIPASFECWCVLIFMSSQYNCYYRFYAFFSHRHVNYGYVFGYCGKTNQCERLKLSAIIRGVKFPDNGTGQLGIWALANMRQANQSEPTEGELS